APAAFASGVPPAGAPGAEWRFLRKPPYHLRLRALFFLLTMTAAIPVYLVTRRLTASDWIALGAALLVLTSFELGYHARWIAPDGLLVALVAWSAWAQLRLMTAEGPGPRWGRLLFASALTGLCVGTKYPAALVFVPLMLAIVWRPSPGRSTGMLVGQIVAAIVVTKLAFLATTPGALKETATFLRDVRFEAAHYQEGHFGYTVGRGLPHLLALRRHL